MAFRLPDPSTATPHKKLPTAAGASGGGAGADDSDDDDLQLPLKVLEVEYYLLFCRPGDRVLMCKGWNSTTATVTGLSPGVMYTFQVSTDTGTWSAPSKPVSILDSGGDFSEGMVLARRRRAREDAKRANLAAEELIEKQREVTRRRLELDVAERANMSNAERDRPIYGSSAVELADLDIADSFAAARSGPHLGAGHRSGVPLKEVSFLVTFGTLLDRGKWNDCTGWDNVDLNAAGAVGVTVKSGHILSIVLPRNHIVSCEPHVDEYGYLKKEIPLGRGFMPESFGNLTVREIHVAHVQNSNTDVRRCSTWLTWT